MTAPRRRSTGARRTGADERLLTATRTLLARDGYDAITSRAIAAESGENLAAITYHFGSKDELVALALVASCRALLEPVLDVLRSDESPADKLASMVVALDALFASSPGERTAYVEALAAARRWDRVRDELRSMWSEVRDVLTEVIDQQRAEGLVPAWTDAAAMANLLLSTANGILTTSAVDPERTDASVVAAQLASLLLAAGRAEGGRPGDVTDRDG